MHNATICDTTHGNSTDSLLGRTCGSQTKEQLELSSEVTPHLVRIWWRDPTGSSGETVAISSSYSFHLNKSTVMQLSRSQAVFQNDLQQNNL